MLQLDIAASVGIDAFPPHDPEPWPALRPACDMTRRRRHALKKGALALEIKVFVAAAVRAGQQADSYDEIDEIHRSTFLALP